MLPLNDAERLDPLLRGPVELDQRGGAGSEKGTRSPRVTHSSG
jgi:hypothetical protein